MSTTNFKTDSYCGIYCGACEILMVYKKGLENNTTPTWDDINPPLSKFIPHSELKCNGCKTDVLFENCKRCSLRKCKLIKNNMVSSCIECDKYPCFRFKLFRFMLKTLKIEKKLPHMLVIDKNLTFIKEHGMENWLKDQEEKWKCPECSTPFSWYQTKCPSCGFDLEPLKDHNNI